MVTRVAFLGIGWFLLRRCWRLIENTARPLCECVIGVIVDMCASCGATRQEASQRYCGQCGQTLPMPAQAAFPAPKVGDAEAPVGERAPSAEAPGNPGADPGPAGSRPRLRFPLVAVLMVLVLGVAVWGLVRGRQTAEPEGMAPVPTTFGDIIAGPEAGLVFVGAAQEPTSLDDPNGPGQLGTYRYQQPPAKAAPDGQVTVAVVSAASIAKGQDQSNGIITDVESPEGAKCVRFKKDSDEFYSCFVDYGKGWVILTSSPPNLTGYGVRDDLNQLTNIAESVKKQNAFERAVQTHANM